MDYKRTFIQSPFTVKAVEALAILSVACAFVLTVSSYLSLPNTIPRHYDMSGKVGAYGPKGLLWLLPGMSLGIWALLSFVQSIPEKLNYPVAVDGANRPVQQALMFSFLAYIKLLISAYICYMIWEITENADGNTITLQAWSMPVFLLALLGLITIYIFKARKKA